MRIIMIPNCSTMHDRHYHLAKNLMKQGHDVHYFMWELPYKISAKQLIKHIFTSLVPKSYRHEEFIVHKAIRLPYFWPIINGWIFKKQLRKLFKDINADIIITESYTNETEVPKDLPFIYDLADDYAAPAEVYGSSIYRLAFKVLGIKRVMQRQTENARAVTAVSEILYHYAKKYNINVLKLPNGVDIDIVNTIKKDKTSKSENKYSMVYVTGFGKWSRAIETLTTIKKLKKEFPKLELTLIGKGSEVNNIKKFIKENHAKKYIHYLGFISDRKKVFNLINKSAIGLNISDKNKWRDAAHPMKVIEYSALGKKIISTDLEEVKKLNFPNVFLLSDKKGSITNTIREALIDNHNHFELISKKVLKEYNWTTLTKSLTNLIESVKESAKKEPSRRIVHVSPAYPPALGGLEKVVQALARTQAKAGMNVAVITSDENAKGTKNTECFPITRLQSWTLANTRIMPTLIFALAKIKKEDIVHLHFTSAYMPELVWLLSKIKGFKYIVHNHIDLQPKSAAGILLKIYKPFILKPILQSAEYVVVFTNDQQKAMQKEYYLTLSKIKIIPNGVEEQFYIETKRKLHKKPRLLFVGRLDKQKNIKQLLYSLQGISRKFETFIVGEGSLKNELIELTKQLKLKDIHFTGKVYGEKLLQYFKRSDIFVLPSEREGMPLALLEAGATGLPVIATDVSGNRDLIKNGKNGFLTPLHDAQKLGETLLKISSDKKLYKTLSNNAQRIATNFTWEKATEEFGKLYKQLQQDTPKKKDKKKTNNKNIVTLWQIVIPLLLAANAAYLLNNFVSWTITLGFFLFIPGYLLLSLLKHEITSRWEIASFSMGLSLLLLMLGGLALNTLNIWGLEQPLTTQHIFTMLDIMTLGLLIFNQKKTFALKTPQITISIRHIVMTFFLTLLPFLAAGGAISLNNDGPNTLTMMLFGMIPVLFMILIWRKELSSLYPYAVFMIGLSVLLTTSLRGWFITGHDIHHEYTVFQNTFSNNLWPVRVVTGDPYNACLSITILPTIIAKITTINPMYVYKLIFQVIFAFGIVPIYLLIKKVSTNQTALIASLLFISFPPFLNDMPFLNRQEIGFVFFSTLMLVTFSEIKRLPKTLITIGILLGLIFSHYASTYVALSIMLIAWFTFLILKKLQPMKQKSILPTANLVIIIGALLFTYIWQTVITVSANNLIQTLTWTIKGIENKNISQQSNGVSYALFSIPRQTPQEILNHYAGENANKISYVPEKDLPLTQLGTSISGVINVKEFNIFIRTFSARSLQILLLLGLIVIYFKQRKKLAEQDAYYYALSIACFFLLVLITLLPQLSVDYSVTRLFQQSLVIIAFPILIAAEFLLGFMGRNKIYIIAAFFLFLFLHLSGSIPQALGGYPPQMALNNSGTYYNIYYVHQSELNAVSWINKNTEKETLIADHYAKLRFITYPFIGRYSIDPVVSQNRSGYLFQDYTNVRSGLYANFLSGNVIEYTYQNNLPKEGLLYTNGSNQISQIN